MTGEPGGGSTPGSAAEPTWLGAAPADASSYGTMLPTYADPPSRRGRGRGFVAVAVGGVLALGASAFAVTSLGSEGPSSPEAAVEALFAAVEDRDVIGVLDTMAPAERRLYQPFVEDVVTELQRLRVLSDDLDLGSVAGVELDVDGLVLESEVLAEGMSVVRVTGGTISSTVDPRRIPVGSFVQDLMEEAEDGLGMEPMTATTPLAEHEPVSIVVLEDDGWHVSLHHSIAEAIRTSAGEPLPDFGAGVQPVGAGSPEEAVRAMVDAGVALDVRRMIELLPPGEMTAVHDYAPLFLDDADEAVAELRAESDFEITVDELALQAETDDGVGRVTVERFAASGRSDGEPFDVTYDGACMSGTFDGEREELCADGEDGVRLAPMSIVVHTVEHDGAWFVSPIRTAFGLSLSSLRALSAEDLEDSDMFPFGVTPLFLGLSPLLYASSSGEEGSGWTSYSSQVAGDEHETCWQVHDDLPMDATDEELEAADASALACEEGRSATATTSVPDTTVPADGER